MKTNKKTFLKIILPVVIIVAGILVFKMMAAHKQPPAHKTVAKSGTLVQVMVAEKGDWQVDISVTGIIVPKREISVIPQVSGKVVYVAPSFQAGTYFPEGAVLLGIEDIDYTLAIERAKAQVTKMEFELTSIQAKADVAKGEWQRSHPGGPAPANSLVLYVPQLKEAAANLSSAKAALQQAEVNLSRTKITAPFNCRVRSEQVGIGQYLTPGSKAAVLVGADEVEAIVPVPLIDLAWLNVPTNAIVQIHSAGQVFSWPGRLTRSLGEVDRVGKMTRLAVTVTDPYNLQLKSPQNRPELALGMFVQVILKGRTAAGVIAVPRQALRENDTLWLMTSENKLKKIQVDISRREQNEILLKGGLMPGDRVVLSKIVGAVEGMSLKLETGEQAR
jgi:RND family efflux transporter MFP subunit